MLADSDAMKLRLALAIAIDVNEREIGGPAAEVANENLLPGLNEPFPILRMGVDPLINGGLRLLNEHDPRQSGSGRRLDCQLASYFVERSWQREHDFLRFEWLSRKAMIPRRANMREIPPARFDRRQPIDVWCSMPREKLC